MAQAECAETNKCQASKETKIGLLKLEKNLDRQSATEGAGGQMAGSACQADSIIPKNKWSEKNSTSRWEAPKREYSSQD